TGYEFIRRYCPCGSKCMNRSFRVGSALPVEVVDWGRKGVGVLTLEKIIQMDLTTQVLCPADGLAVGLCGLDMLRLVRSSTHRGGVLRFMSHCCVLNCRIEKQNIAAGSDVVYSLFKIFDYCFDCSHHAIPSRACAYLYHDVASLKHDKINASTVGGHRVSCPQ
ncbi:hypothetical protein GN958_ATG17588, partial [Phytophthora infestans]